ncbi:tRNA (guanosine(46)-N7)-methyltransferase TrmB [Holzapfeliella floricola]|nr:tRNA (guanosine(46)-N7)-methyltransferase TrmB [Holzapfeliella floricola]
MRLRRKPWTRNMIEQNPDYILDRPKAGLIDWSSRFENPDAPLYIEVGSGKGQFIINQAKKHPDVNFVAIEIQEAAIGMILRKQLEEQLPNLQLFLGNGEALTDYFAENSVSKVFLNFSDPWPKTKHEKRRLTYKSFLDIYKTILQPNKGIEFKTDNQSLYNYSVQSFNNYGMHFDFVSVNLHDSKMAEDNIMTEYEEKFSAKGQPIYALYAHFSA